MMSWRKRAPLLFMSVCAAWFLRVNLWRQLPELTDGPSDFLHYYRGAQRVVTGQTPYANAPEFDYPPLVTFMMAPLTYFDYVTARRIWFGLSEGWLLLAGWLMWRALGSDALAGCCVCLVWAFGGAAAENLTLGQLGPLLALLLALAYTRTSITQGATVGLGLGLKFLPGVLSIAIALRRDSRALMTLAASAVISLGVPWIALFGLSGPKTPFHADYWMGTPAVLSWSLPSVLLRALDPPSTPDGTLPKAWEHGNDPTNLHLSIEQRLMSFGLGAVTMATGVIMLARGGALKSEQLPWAMAGLASLGLAVSPIGWSHYQVMQYPGLALLFCRAARLRAWRLGAWTLACGALLYPLPVAVLTTYYQRHAGWTAASPVTLYFWTSVTPLASLGLFGCFLMLARTADIHTGCSP